ncbi:LuxR C-terminal-related transcriptional regulator [Archangium sp.]|uniref:LuxR C-terminal-related transcriptional regulator n=1 Tax=Archangium sp. TaxID=1872627 RepID=UPI002D2D9F82|nr:LuxR C-terminal-related transcriptional regulator [Archangium sp.]HYO57744.1 LuxR C-terminal-related transcriptional regulator [Archangium sp.]
MRVRRPAAIDAMQQLEDVLNAFQACAHIEELTAVMNALVLRLGYVGFGYLDRRRLPHTDEPHPFSIFTVRADFGANYIREDFVSYDPVVARCTVTNAPFTWSDCPEFHERGRPRRGLKSHARRVIEAAYDFGYTEGFVIPSHAVDALGEPVSTGVSLFWSGSTRCFGTPETMPRWLRLIALSYHERISELRGLASNESLSRPSLTDRERECLAWACRGKTGGETATILGIGERTVEFHLQNAMRKLGVHNKVHAIAVAMRRGLVAP